MTHVYVCLYTECSIGDKNELILIRLLVLYFISFLLWVKFSREYFDEEKEAQENRFKIDPQNDWTRCALYN
jgi:hypothetical protein